VYREGTDGSSGGTQLTKWFGQKRYGPGVIAVARLFRGEVRCEPLVVSDC
jgi:hypothetical protein